MFIQPKFIAGTEDDLYSMTQNLIKKDKESEYKTWSIHCNLLDIFDSSCKQGYLEPVKLILKKHKNPHFDPAASIFANIYGVIEAKYSEILNLFLKNKRFMSDPYYSHNLIRYATQFGYTNIVEATLYKVKSHFEFNDLFVIASQEGKSEIVKLLLSHPKVDPSFEGYWAFGLAAQNGHVEVVNLLMSDPRVDPFFENNRPLKVARENGHEKVVKVIVEKYKASGRSEVHHKS